MNSGSSAFIFSASHRSVALAISCVIPEITSGLLAHGSSAALATITLSMWGFLEGLVGDRFEGDVLAARSDVRGDEHLAVGVVDASFDRVGAETAEDDRVNRPMRAHASIATAVREPWACRSRRGRLGNPFGLEDVGEMQTSCATLVGNFLTAESISPCQIRAVFLAVGVP